MPLLGVDPDEELTWVQASTEHRRRARTAAQAWDASQVAYAAHLARMMPWAAPSVILALAKGNASAATIQQAAQLSARERAQRPGNGVPYGTPVIGANLTPGHRRLLLEDITQGPRRTAQYEARQGAPARDIETAVGHAQAVGLIRDGILHEPAKDSPDRRIFDALSQRFLDAGEELEFVDVEGRPIRQYATYSSSHSSAEEAAKAGEPFKQHYPGQREVIGYDPEKDPKRIALREAREERAGPTGFSALVRAGAMTFDAPLQEGTGLIRSAYGTLTGRGDAAHWEPQSDLAIMLEDPTLSAGSGFFVDPDSEVAKERRRREKEQGGLLDGHRITLGRLTATYLTPLEPDETPYRVVSGLTDAVVAVVADPTAVGLGKAAKAREAAKLFTVADEAAEGAGLLNGLRRGVSRPDVDAWLNGSVGSGVVDEIAAEASPTEIWRRTGRKLHPREVTALADADTGDKVRDVLKPLLGTEIRSTDDAWRSPTGLWSWQRPGGRTQRMLNEMPGRVIDLENPTSAMTEVERWGRNANFDDATLTGYLDRLARSRSRNETFEVVADVMDHTDGVLAAGGVTDPAVRSRLVRQWRQTHAQDRIFTVDETGQVQNPWDDVLLGDTTVRTPSPHLDIEHINRFVPLPDPRPVRRLTTKYPNIFGGSLTGTKTGELRLPLAVADYLQSQIWRPFVLLRAAWPVRVIGEEQLRMAAAGHASVFRDPLSFIAWATGRKGATDVIGAPLAESDELAAAMSREMGGWLDFSAKADLIPSGHKTIYRHTAHEAEQFRHAWADEIVTLHNSPTARQVARSASLDDAEEWFVRGDGRRIFDELAASHPELREPGVARRYLETVSKRLERNSGGNGEILDAVRTGSLRGKRITDSDGMRPSDTFMKALGDLDDAAPAAVVGDEVALVPGGTRLGTRGRAIRDWAFNGLMSKPTNYLSRSPVFKQTYWKEINRLMPFASVEARDAIIAQAGKAGLSRRTLRGLSRKTGGGELTAAEIDLLAKGHALDETNKLLYTLSRRSQIADSMRVVAPFGEAWKEMVTTWATLGNPLSARGLKNWRRFQQGVQGARGEEFGEVMGAPDGHGFFYKNSFGEEVFAYPFSATLTKALTGVPVPLTGRVQGLNLMTEVLPGLGPVAQVPIPWIIHDEPGWQRQLREILLPYGDPTKGDSSAVTQLLTWAPAWMRRAVGVGLGEGWDPESTRLYGNSQMAMAQYLYSTGRYDISTPAGQQKLMEDAKSSARRFALVRGIAQFGAPSAPAPDWMVQDAGGKLVQLDAVRIDYQRMKDEDWETADQRFLEKWGPDLALVMQPYTREVTAGVQPTQQFEDWQKAHKDLARDFPATWAFFGPRSDDPDNFDYGVYAAQIHHGDRQALAPTQWILAASDLLGRMQYRHFQAKMPDNPTNEDLEWLRGKRQQIADEYPGYGDPIGLVEKASTSDLIAELGRAVDDPRVLDTDAGAGTALYLKFQAKALEASGTVNVSKADEFAADREWLARKADEITQQHPAFAYVFDRVFARELETD